MSRSIGVHTSSLQSLLVAGRDPVDVLVEAVKACGAQECELLAPQIEAQFGGPHAGHGTMSSMSPQMMRRELRKWRLRTPSTYFEAIGSRFQKAGIAIRACNHPLDLSFSDQEIDRGLEMAKALGAGVLTTQAEPGLTARIAPLAAQHRVTVAFTGQTGPDLLHVSPHFRLVADTAQLASAGVDAAEYVRAHHADIAAVRVSCDRIDAPVHQALDAIAREGWPIGIFVEHRGATNPIDDVKRCLAALNAS